MLVVAVTIGTPRPHALARFYAELLDTPVSSTEAPAPGEPAEGGWAQLRVPGGPTLNFEYERNFRRPVWPSIAGEQTASQHLDIEVTDLDAAVAHAVACGATPAEHQPQSDVRVLFDPDGHPFCLCR